jgi:AcrR family transcriptional regulator
MEKLSIHIKVSSELFLKNPADSKLGRLILSESLNLIAELGFEGFTFKKLGEKIGSPESSIYRYFKSKHTLLIYLTSWYWSALEYKLAFATANQESNFQTLKIAINSLTKPLLLEEKISFLDEELMKKLVITEFVKTYHTKAIDDENRMGYFSAYKQLVERLSTIILNINQAFKYPHMLASTIIEGIHEQRFFASHLPALTDISSEFEIVENFYIDMAIKMIKK